MHIYITILSGLNQQQIYHSAEVVPGTPQHLRWSSMQQLQTVKSCLLLP